MQPVVEESSEDEDDDDDDDSEDDDVPALVPVKVCSKLSSSLCFIAD